MLEKIDLKLKRKNCMIYDIDMIMMDKKIFKNKKKMINLSIRIHTSIKSQARYIYNGSGKNNQFTEQ